MVIKLKGPREEDDVLRRKHTRKRHISLEFENEVQTHDLSGKQPTIILPFPAIFNYFR